MTLQQARERIRASLGRKCYADFPLYYYPQINALIEVTGREWCDLFVWTPEDHKMWRVQRNKAAFETLLPHYTRFWACVQTDLVPPNPASTLLPLIRGWVENDVILFSAEDLREHMRMLEDTTYCKYYN